MKIQMMETMQYLGESKPQFQMNDQSDIKDWVANELN